MTTILCGNASVGSFLKRWDWLAIFSNHRSGCNCPWVNKSFPLRAHEPSPSPSRSLLPTWLHFFHPLPLLKVSITSLGTHYTGGHMQPYVAHRPPPCGVTRVITRHTQPETRHKKNRHSARYTSTSGQVCSMQRTTRHWAADWDTPAFEPPAFHHPSSPQAKAPPDGDLIRPKKPNEYTLN